MKKILGVAAFLLVATASFSIRENVGAPTTGSINGGSWVNVRVTANVVDGIAVNEASPIDFGNLVRDTHGTKQNGSNIYQPGEMIRENTPGIVTYRANEGAYNNFKTYLETDRIDLSFVSSSGVEDIKTRTQLTNVRIVGISKGNTGDDVSLVNGQAQRKLTAWFKAYDSSKADGNGDYTENYENGNLGSNQKLGNYEGTVKVFAVATSKAIGSN